MNRNDRTIVNIHEAAFDAYDLEGPLQDDMSLLSVSYGPETRRGIYVMRMEPGAATIPHTHECMEEFLILEGELIESDGTVLRRATSRATGPAAATARARRPAACWSASTGTRPNRRRRGDACVAPTLSRARRSASDGTPRRRT